MDALLFIDLPEDDTTVLGTAEAVAGRCVAQLGINQIARSNHGFAEFSYYVCSRKRQ
jgi:hypothetical protein